MFNWFVGTCPWCGRYHDDGAWLQFEDRPTIYVCHDCYDEYLEDLEDSQD